MKREKYRLTTEDFIIRSKEKHGDKYDYSKSVYKNKRTKVIIRCKIHNIEFEQLPGNHFNGQGCPICGKKTAQERTGNYRNKRKTKEEFQRDLNRLYGDKYEVLGEYVNNKTKIKIFCHNKNANGQEHGIFYIKPNDLICGHGCKRCVHSKLEEEIEKILIENNIQYETQKIFKDWLGEQRLDFYLPYYNVAIECQGRQHFEPVDFGGNGKDWAVENFEKIKKLDQKKFELCKNNGIIIYYFSDKDYECENLYTNKEILINKIINYDN